ncbi:hypothetical protein Tco_1035708 [Tanacetum coccineum]
MRPIAPSVPLKLIGWQLMNSLQLHCLAIGASLGLVVLSIFAMLAAYASRAVISNPEASQSNLVISHLLPLKFSNSSMSLLEFSFQINEILLYNHPTFSETFYFVFYVLNTVEREFISKFPQFAPRDVPDLSYESFLLSQILEVGQK